MVDICHDICLFNSITLAYTNLWIQFVYSWLPYGIPNLVNSRGSLVVCSKYAHCLITDK